MNGPNNPIGWIDYTWNPVKGLCPEACEYCYARRIYARFHYDPAIRLDEKSSWHPTTSTKSIMIGVMVLLLSIYTVDAQRGRIQGE